MPARVVIEPFLGYRRGAVLDRPMFFWRDDPQRERHTLPLEDVVDAGVRALEAGGQIKRRPGRPRRSEPDQEDGEDAGSS